ncbi:hypothetical protein KTU01_19540 [Kocuria turfanensis]|uniref:Uncharacterized protein n=1 Tax=Kocuria turfanensis TaxID=388357 RepID=A0A512IDS3_9MICC|nr:hypothetical protein KTU01_19540 [Kocuria turfanensis]
MRQLTAEYVCNPWEFADEGAYLAFEDPAAYEAARIPDRLTAERLAAYCRAMGIDPFSVPYYGSRAVLLRRPVDVLGRVPGRSLR